MYFDDEIVIRVGMYVRAYEIGGATCFVSQTFWLSLNLNHENIIFEHTDTDTDTGNDMKVNTVISENHIMKNHYEGPN